MNRSWTQLCENISEAVGKSVRPDSATPLSGGCIHDATRLATSAGPFFVKQNTLQCLDQFQAETRSLCEIADSNTIRVPRPILATAIGQRAVLVLEFIEFGRGDSAAARHMGHQLAEMHSVTQARFGWSEDNYIGPTPQPNTVSDHWSTFFRDQRLRWQFGLLAKSGVEFREAEALLDRIESFFDDASPEPSLLHGDLWGGNAGYDKAGNPVVFDPASYFGHDEADIAFTELFGGFTPDFYEGYYAVRPQRPGYARRRDLYNLYHILNHALLFGGGYAAQAESMIRRLARG